MEAIRGNSVEGPRSGHLETRLSWFWAHRTPADPGRPCAGLPWTEEEHRSFLSGLKKLGKVTCSC